jgi:hypothetical protein
VFVDDLSPYSAPRLSLYINIAVSLQQRIGHSSLLQRTLPAGPTQWLDRAAPESNLCDHIPPGGWTCSPRPPPVGLIGAKLKGIFPFSLFSPILWRIWTGEDSLIPKRPLSTGRAAHPILIYSVLFLQAWRHCTTLSYQQPVVKKLPTTRWMIILWLQYFGGK